MDNFDILLTSLENIVINVELCHMDDSCENIMKICKDSKRTELHERLSKIREEIKTIQSDVLKENKEVSK